MKIDVNKQLNVNNSNDINTDALKNDSDDVKTDTENSDSTNIKVSSVKHNSSDIVSENLKNANADICDTITRNNGTGTSSKPVNINSIFSDSTNSNSKNNDGKLVNTAVKDNNISVENGNSANIDANVNHFNVNITKASISISAINIDIYNSVDTINTSSKNMDAKVDCKKSDGNVLIGKDNIDNLNVNIDKAGICDTNIDSNQNSEIRTYENVNDNGTFISIMNSAVIDDFNTNVGNTHVIRIDSKESDGTDTNSVNNEKSNIDHNIYTRNANLKSVKHNNENIASISDANTCDVKNLNTANASSDNTDIDDAGTDTTRVKKKKKRRGKKRKKPSQFARFCIRLSKLRLNDKNINQNNTSDPGALNNNVNNENIIVYNTDDSCAASVRFFDFPVTTNYITKYIAKNHTPQNISELVKETALSSTPGNNIISSLRQNVSTPKQNEIYEKSDQSFMNKENSGSESNKSIPFSEKNFDDVENELKHKLNNTYPTPESTGLQIHKRKKLYAEKAEKPKSPNARKTKDEQKYIMSPTPGPSGLRAISTPKVNSENKYETNKPLMQLCDKYGNSVNSTARKDNQGSQSKTRIQCSEKDYEEISSEELEKFTNYMINQKNLLHAKKQEKPHEYESKRKHELQDTPLQIDQKNILYIGKEEKKSKPRYNLKSKDEPEDIIYPKPGHSRLQKNTTATVIGETFENKDQRTMSKENSGSQSKNTRYSWKDYVDVSSEELDEFTDDNTRIMHNISDPQTGNALSTIDQDITKTNQHLKFLTRTKTGKKNRWKNYKKRSGVYNIDNRSKNIQQIQNTPDSLKHDEDSSAKVTELRPGVYIINKRPKNIQQIQNTPDSLKHDEDSSENVTELHDDDKFNKSIPIIQQDNVSQFINTFKQAINLEEKLAKKQQQRNVVEIELSGDKSANTSQQKDEPKESTNQEVLAGLSSDIKEVVRDNVRRNMNPEQRMRFDEMDEPKDSTNQEVLAGLSSDIKEVVRDNVRRNMNPELRMRFDEMVSTIRSPAGVPRSFLKNQESFGAIEPQKDFTNDPPISRWDVQTPMSHIRPGVETQGFDPTASANVGQRQVYSPTEVYAENVQDEEDREGSESPDILEAGQKRQSAFERLGPMAQPKKPKLTINLNLNKDQAVREVVEIKKDVPVHDDERIINSNDETVVKFLPSWPWKKQVVVKKTVTLRHSKTVMMMEKEQMEELYDKETSYIMITATGYPPSWTKEDLLDLILENVKGNTFIPCFIEFNSKECKFLVARCRGALLAIHWLNFTIRKDDVVVTLSISTTTVTPAKVDKFIPRMVLRHRLKMDYDWVGKLGLSEFTLKHDISHFIYFPLNRECNQSELVHIRKDVAWEYLTELDLSRNRITSLEGFNLESTTPRLRALDLSHNYIDSIKPLLGCRQLPLKRLSLEGNPLCTDYTDPDRYVQVMRTIFSTLRELDGVPIVLKGDMPPFVKNYCPEEAKPVVEKFLEVFFPLLELPPDDRKDMYPMYTEKAVMTITYRNRMRYDPKFKYARNLLIKSRVLFEGDDDEVYGASSITKLLTKWPSLQHDPSTFTVDVMFHSEMSTVVRVTGLLKLTAESLAEDETLLAFSRTVHLHTKNGYDYRITNEMLYWDEPTHECAKTAFQMISAPKKVLPLDLKFESPPDDYTKEQLVKIFMKITDLEKLPSERCLEAKDWHIQHALEYFIKLLKSDNIQCLMN